MSLKERLLNLIQTSINDINLDLIYDNLEINSLVDKSSLIVLAECIYYRTLLTTHRKNEEMLGYLSLLRDKDADISMFTYLYIIYRLEKFRDNKNESIDELNIYM
jgi:hypothetical protein